MDVVKIIVGTNTHIFVKGTDDIWRVSYELPDEELLFTATLTSDSAENIQLETSDAELITAVISLVKDNITPMGARMYDYYPKVIQDLLEFQALMKVEGFEVDFFHTDISFIVNEAYFSTMSEDRIAEWEQQLNITPGESDTVEDRRDVIIARIRGNGKLNSTLIDSIVNAFTNYHATSYVADSTLYVKLEVPPGNKQYKFANVERELELRKPAHLDLVVTRNYSTWDEIKTDFDDWTDISTTFNSWEDVMLYIATQTT